MPLDLHRHWNANTHHHRLVLAEVGPGARTALDAGTGDGLLADDLRELVPSVTAIDRDPGVVERARSRSGADITWVVGDILTYPLPENGFDVVASNTVVHHLPDLGAGLARLAALTAPGGVLVVIGCARTASPADLVMDGVGVVAAQVYKLRYGLWKHSAPVNLDYPHTYTQARRIAAATLPGMRWRRSPMFRYVIAWRKPA